MKKPQHAVQVAAGAQDDRPGPTHIIDCPPIAAPPVSNNARETAAAALDHSITSLPVVGTSDEHRNANRAFPIP